MADDKTEKATPRHRQQARDKGQFAYSPEFTSALALTVTLVTAFFTLSSTGRFRTLLETMLVAVVKGSDSDKILIDLFHQAGIVFITAVAPIFGAAVLATLAGNFIQGLPIFPSDASFLKWDQLNPMQGLSRLKAKASWTEWLKIGAFGVIAGAVLWTTLSMFWQRLISSPARDIEASNILIHDVLVRVLGYIVGTAAIIAVGDFFIQRFKYEKNIKQTKTEVKEDMKATEGNPHIRGKIRSIQRGNAKKRMMARVKEADVIITNPTHFAVALEYKPGKMQAPRVIAKGQGWIAQQIKKLGREYDIPAVENVPLARALYRSVELDQEIPAELYKAVAEVLAFVFKLRKRM